MENNNGTSLAQLAKALALAQAEMKAAPMNKLNPYFKSKYADLNGIWDTCRIPLTKNGLSVTQSATSVNDVVTVSTMLLHNSGEYLKSDLSLKAKDATPQSIGSAITYGRRYGLSAMVGISCEDDDDVNTAQNTNGQKLITTDQLNVILDNLADLNLNPEPLLKFLKIDSLEHMTVADYPKAIAAIDTIRKRAENNADNKRSAGKS